MDFKTKRQTKKIANILLTLSYTIIGISSLLLILYAILFNGKSDWIIFIFIIPGFIAIIFGLIGISFANKIRDYKNSIIFIRHNTKLLKIIDLIKTHNYPLAVSFFNSSDFSKFPEDEHFLWGLFVGSSLYSNDIKRIKKANEKIEIIYKSRLNKTI